MEPTFTVILAIFFILAIVMLLLLFGDPRDLFTSTEPTLISATISSTGTRKDTAESHPRMPSPPSHLTKGFERAPSLNSPYPKNLPPLGFEHVSALPEQPQLFGGSVPYPMGEISEMPQPYDMGVPFYVPNNSEWAEIEEQIVRDVANDPQPRAHPPSYEEAITESVETVVRNRKNAHN